MTHEIDLINEQLARLRHRHDAFAALRRRTLLERRAVAVRRLARTEAKHARRDAPTVRRAR